MYILSISFNLRTSYRHMAVNGRTKMVSEGHIIQRNVFFHIPPPPLKTSGSNKETFAEVALKAAMDFARTR